MESDETRTYVNLEPEAWDLRQPETSLIVACFRVERYLPDFLRSLDVQTAVHEGHELIFVIDGCPERSEELVREWMHQSDFPVRVIVQPNRGVAAARNAGIAAARGRWISSPDPDDVLHPDYLRDIAHSRNMYPAESMFVGRIRFVNERGTEQEHPLDFKYGSSGTRIVDLLVEPDAIQTLGGVVFFDRHEIQRHQLSVRTDLPTASDADFIMQYLIATRARYVLIPSAEYFYQRRADGSSIVKSQESNIARNVVVFGVSHRELLRRAGTQCPQWLANTLLYFAFYLFRRNRTEHSPVYSTPRPVLAEISREFRTNLQLIGSDRIMKFRLHDVPVDIRAAWLAATGALRSSPVELLNDRGFGIARVAVYSPEANPPMGLQLAGKLGRIVAVKTRSVEYLEEEWVFQHIVLVESREGTPIRLTCDPHFPLEFDGTALTAARLREKWGLSKPRVLRQKQGEPVRISEISRKQRLSVGLHRVLAKLRRAKYSLPLRWYRLMKNRTAAVGAIVCDLDGIDASARPDVLRCIAGIDPNVPVWIVGSSLTRAEHRVSTRVIRPGGVRHFVVMKHTRVLITGDANRGVPFPADVLGHTWARVLVLEAELGPHSYWSLNAANVDGVLARSSIQEQVLVADRGRYRFTASEVRVVASADTPEVSSLDERASAWLQEMGEWV
ncbi:glycosyltransferase family 2 protein [Leucobacter sp. NPDC058333]|uniref:glycosyltransferase family 2 protein n=1 Tax=Leucobacter sp. NPDC058333 TaxID=3346450 RepID=UPI00366089EB